MPEYRLTQQAEDDLFRIALYGIDRFGPEQTRKYYNELVGRLANIAENPERYALVEHIRRGYRRSVCGVHSIYFRPIKEGVEIVRILGQQSLDQL